MMKKLLLLSTAVLCLKGAMAQRYLTPQFTNVTVTRDVKYAENSAIIPLF
jgi:hypothetical protein